MHSTSEASTEKALQKVPQALPVLSGEVESAKKFAEASRSTATRRAYRSDWHIFSEWCASRGLPSLPASPEAVCAFLASQAESGIKAATLGRRMAAIRLAHTSAGLESPAASEAVRTTMRGIRREIGTKPVQKAPATAERIIEMASHCPDTLKGKRDRALLLLGFGGAFRRSELAALNVEDLEEVEGGFRVHVLKSKTDQEGAGEVVPVIRGNGSCPVIAVNAWLEAAGITDGPVFRRMAKGGKVLPHGLTAHSIAAIVKEYAEKAGLDPAEFAGHSLRAGFLTSAASNGAGLFAMMDVSRHRSVESVRGYVRRAEEFQDHAGEGLL